MPARGNGWAAASEPRTGRIVGMLTLENPENYACWYMLLMKILWIYQNVNCIIHDRACKLLGLLQVQSRSGHLTHLRSLPPDIRSVVLLSASE